MAGNRIKKKNYGRKFFGMEATDREKNYDPALIEESG